MTAVEGVLEAAADWKPGGRKVVEALRGLTRAERAHVERGYIHGETPGFMVHRLKHKAMFYLHIDSPNGRCGTMELTPLGESVRTTIKARQASRQPNPCSRAGQRGDRVQCGNPRSSSLLCCIARPRRHRPRFRHSIPKR